MELIVFIGLFIAILLLLVGIAKYGIREKSYEDILKEKGIDASVSTNDIKKKIKKPKKTASQQQSKKSKTDETVSESESEEEEQLTPVPDPFTNKVRSRYGVHSQPQASQPQQQQSKSKSIDKNDGAFRTSSSSSTVGKNVAVSPQQQVKEIPKAVVKPNQTKIEAITPKQQQQKTQTILTNGDHGSGENGAFIVYGIKKPKQPQSDNEAPVKQISLKAAPIVNGEHIEKQQAIKQQTALVNGHQQSPPANAKPTDYNNEQIAAKKEIERINLTLTEKEKAIEALNQVNTKLKADVEK